MSVNTNLSGETRKPAELVAEYIHLRDLKEKAVATMKELLQERYIRRMDEIEKTLLDQLNSIGAESLKTDAGTCFKKTETSVTVSDGAAFQRHVIGTQQWELIDFRANKTAVKAYVAENDIEPPGVNMERRIILSVRRPS